MGLQPRGLGEGGKGGVFFLRRLFFWVFYFWLLVLMVVVVVVAAGSLQCFRRPGLLAVHMCLAMLSAICGWKARREKGMPGTHI